MTAPQNFAAAMQTGTTPPKTQRPPSRRGTRGWVVHLDPDRHRRLKIAAVAHDRSLQSLGEEAAELLLERYGV